MKLLYYIVILTFQFPSDMTFRQEEAAKETDRKKRRSCNQSLLSVCCKQGLIYIRGRDYERLSLRRTSQRLRYQRHTERLQGGQRQGEASRLIDYPSSEVHTHTPHLQRHTRLLFCLDQIIISEISVQSIISLLKQSCIWELQQRQ